MGLVIDVLIAFLAKLFVRFHRTWGCRDWPRVQATLQSSSVGGGWTLNCPTTELTYRYSFQGEGYVSCDRKPFFSGSSAKGYVARYGPGATPWVRVNPNDPSQSVLRRADQPEWDW
jgi:hypothetical protein